MCPCLTFAPFDRTARSAFGTSCAAAGSGMSATTNRDIRNGTCSRRLRRLRFESIPFLLVAAEPTRHDLYAQATAVRLRRTDVGPLAMDGQSRVTALRFIVRSAPGLGSSRTPITVLAGRWATISSA